MHPTPVIRFFVLAPLLALAACATARNPAATPVQDAAAARAAVEQAQAGDTVWAVFYFVKPDKRAQYERFVHEVFWPMLQRVGRTDPLVRRASEQARILHPTRANEDGTYTYAFLMDPVVSGADYSILNLLKKGYGEAEGQRIFQQVFQDALADRPYEFHRLVQSRE